MAKIYPPQINGKDEKGRWKADIEVMKLGLPSNYYTYDPEAYQNRDSWKCDEGSDKDCNSVRKKKDNEFWIVRNEQECPYCSSVHRIDDVEKYRYLHEKRVVTLKHCYWKPGKDGKSKEVASATLHVLTFQRYCSKCKKMYRDSINDLRYKRKEISKDGTEEENPTRYAITNDLGEYIRKASLTSNFKDLSEKFGISIRIIEKLYNEEVDSKDREKRTIPQPEHLGLYTMEFKDTDEKGRKTQYCLCVDEKKQTFVGFFMWNKAKQKEKFFDSIPDISKVAYVFINLDDKAAYECRKIFKNAKIIVERRDVLRRSRNAAEKVYEEAKKLYPEHRNELSSYEEILLLPNSRYFKDCLYHDMITCYYEEIPTLMESYLLHEKIKQMYEKNEIVCAEIALRYWMDVNKEKMLPEKKLETLLKRHRDSVLAFITLYGAMAQTSKEREEYEKVLDDVEHPIEHIASDGIHDNYAMRHAGWKYLYGHIMYGVMVRVNQRRLEEYSHRENYVFCMDFLKAGTFMQRWREMNPQYVTFNNFSIPLKEMFDALIDMFERPISEEPLIPIYFVPDSI